MLKATGNARNVVPHRLDLSQCVHIKPYAAACLAALGAAGNGSVSIQHPINEDCHQHLSRMGFFQWFANECHSEASVSRESNVPIRQIRGGSGSFPDEAMEVWAKQVERFAAGQKSVLAAHLDEIIMNAVTHAKSSVGCLVAGQAFPRKRRVEVAVVDLGQTIRMHLAGNPRYGDLVTDEQAILAATEEGVTGTVDLNCWNEPNSGAGLASLRAFCEQGGGELTIMSGKSAVVFGSGHPPKVHGVDEGYDGCLVNVRFYSEFSLPTEETDAIIF